MQRNQKATDAQRIAATETVARRTRDLEQAENGLRATTSRLEKQTIDLAQANEKWGRSQSAVDGFKQNGQKSGVAFGKQFLATAGGFLAANLVSDIGSAIIQGIQTGVREGFRYALGGVDLASSLAETKSAVGQVFGEASGDVIAFSKNSVTALGATQQEALLGAKTFGIFGKSAKLQGRELSSFSTDLLTLATDLGSFNDTSTDEAIEALGAGLRGESEPLRKYGVLLDDATLRQEALRLGLIKTTKQALTPQQRVLAANASIFAQTKDQQGDFARTSGGLAGQTKILAKSFAEAQTELGTALVPAMTTLTTLANEKLIPVLGEVVDKVGPVLAKALVESAPAFSDLVTAIGPLIPDLVRLSVEVLPILIQGLILLAPLMIDWAKNTAAMSAVFTGFFALLNGDTSIGELVKKVTGIGGSWQAVSASVAGSINSFLSSVVRPQVEGGARVGAIVSLFTSIPGKIQGAFSGAGSFLYTAGRDLINGLIDGAKSLLKNLGNTFANMLPVAIRGPFKDALGIHSPSTEFARYGLNIVQGLVGGVVAATPLTKRPLGSLVSIPDVSSSVSAVAKSGSSSAAGSGAPMAIRGTLDLGNGLVGYVNGVIDGYMDNVLLAKNAGGLA